MLTERLGLSFVYSYLLIHNVLSSQAIMYLNLFGSEYGWVLYREVKTRLRKEKRLITRYPLCK